jgi:arsenate reductase (thioredoxin)
MLNIAFICTHNSCRSIIAEAVAKSIASKHFNAYSAGSTPSGKINAKALEILQNNHIRTNNLTSKSIDNLSQIRFEILMLLGIKNKSMSSFFIEPNSHGQILILPHQQI